MNSKLSTFFDSTELMGIPDALSARMDNDGYVYLKGVLEKNDVALVRDQILKICAENSWVTFTDSGQPIALDPVSPPQPEYYDVYNRLISLQAFNDLAYVPAIRQVMSILLGSDQILVRPAKFLRLMFPQKVRNTTPVHQDFVHEQGTERAYTCWIPLGDCPVELGGVSIMPGSHRVGVLPHGFIPGTGGLGISKQLGEATWKTVDYEMGDVVIFHSLTAHCGLPNTTDRLRLSMDCRYQLPSDPVPEHSLLPTGGQISWEEVYEGWSDSDKQYEWHQYSLTPVGYDYFHYENRDREILDLAEQGNADALGALPTIIRRSRNRKNVAHAERLLSNLEPEQGGR